MNSKNEFQKVSEQIEKHFSDYAGLPDTDAIRSSMIKEMEERIAKGLQVPSETLSSNPCSEISVSTTVTPANWKDSSGNKIARPQPFTPGGSTSSPVWGKPPGFQQTYATSWSNDEAHNVKADRHYIDKDKFLDILSSLSIVERADIMFDDREDNGMISIRLQLLSNLRKLDRYQRDRMQGELTEFLHEFRIKGARKIEVMYSHKEVLS